jgi:hypothetical protein
LDKPARRVLHKSAIDGYGAGEHLLNDIDMHALGYECAKHFAGERVTHVFLRKRV